MNLVKSPAVGSRGWLVVGLLWFVVFSNYLARLLPTTMHASIIAAMPMTDAQFGLITASLFLTYGLTSPLAGFLADRFSRSRVIVICMFVWSVITWLTSYARTFNELLALRTLMGVSEACYLPAALALITDYHRGPTRALATGIHNSGYAVGIGLSGLGGWMAEQYSWHYAFAVVGISSLVYCLLLPALLRDAPRSALAGSAAPAAPDRLRFGPSLASILSRGSFILLLVTFGVYGMTAWAVFAWTPVFLQEHLHLSQGNAGLTATVSMNVGAVLGMLIGGYWSDKWSRTNIRGRMFVPAIGFLIASPALLVVTYATNYWVAAVGLLVFRLFLSFHEANMMPILCEVVDPRLRGTGYGLLNMVGSIGGGLGIFFPGLLRDLKIELNSDFGVVAVMFLVYALMFYLIRPGGPRPIVASAQSNPASGSSA